jgi:hypothetical protein
MKKNICALLGDFFDLLIQRSTIEVAMTIAMACYRESIP